MARRSDRISMPTSTAGITRYFEDYKTKFSLQPGHVILIILVIIALVLFLHSYGNAFFQG